MKPFYSTFIGFVLVFIVVAFAAESIAACGSLYDKRRYRGGSLISDHTASGIGDIVTIIIEEESSASHDVKTSTKKDTGAEALIETLFYPSQEFFKDDKENPTWKWDSTADYSGTGSTESKGKLEAKLTARVIDVFPNGNLLIEGSRTIQVDESKLKVILTGTIRPQDIQTDNTVKSTYIADAKIEYQQEGLGNMNKFGLLTRLWNWLNIF
jgi:flagellar L-ring protein precursor FlgH